MRANLKGVDQERVGRAVREILEAIGEDPAREGLRETPRRIAEMYEELFAGLKQDPREVLSKGFQESHREMVILKNIPFYSLCEHLFLPFHGRAHVGYVPEGRLDEPLPRWVLADGLQNLTHGAPDAFLVNSRNGLSHHPILTSTVLP